VARTYLTGLVAVVHEICKYTTKYGPVIFPLLSSPEKELLQALIATCQSFMASSIVEKAKND
jgi:hypothetical protein